MKKKILAVVLSIVLVVGVVCVFASCDGKKEDDKKEPEKVSDLAYIQDKGKAVIGITEYEPMNYKDENGEWTGFETEFAQAVCKKLNVEAEFFLLSDWDQKVNELNVKTVDLIWNGMTITPEMQESMSISKPYLKNAQVIVTKKDNAEKYNSLESIKDAKISVETGSAGEALVKDFKGTKAVDYQSNALLEVKSGAADVCVIDLAMANSMIGEGKTYEDLVYTAELEEEFFGVGCRKGSDTVEAINKAIDELKADGTLQKLADKYELVLAD